MKLTGGQIILNALKQEGVPYILGIPGHGILGLFDAVRESDTKGDVRYIQVKHEQAAVHIADGYYRMTGRPLATLSSIGPGSLNTAIGLATAYVDSSAVISFCGDTHTNMKGVGVLQEIERYQDSNFLRALEPLVKRSWRVENVEQLPRIMKRAFSQMLSGRHGPVAVALPMDVQADSMDLNELPGPVLLPEARVKTDEASIESAVKLMKSAHRPVILAGGGALRARSAQQLLEIAKRWGAAVVTTMAGKSAFPEMHPQYGFHTGSKGTPIGISLCREADVILALGVRFADETTSSYRDGVSFSFPRTKLIHVDLQSEEINKNYRADLGIIGDINSVVDQLLAAYGPAEERPEYLAEIVQKREEWFTAIEKKRIEPKEGISISQLLGVMNAVLPEDTIITTSSGNTQAQLFQEYCFAKPYTCLTTGGFSTMGWAMPAAIGAKLACPDQPVVALMGDGDFLMTMQEISTIVQYDVPVVVIMADNRGWYAIKDLQRDIYGEKYIFGNDWICKGETYTADYAAIAKGFGMNAWRVQNRESLKNAIKDALAYGGPAFIVADVCREVPYTGGDAYGWWDVPVPGYIPDRRAAYEAGRANELLI